MNKTKIVFVYLMNTKMPLQSAYTWDKKLNIEQVIKCENVKKFPTHKPGDNNCDLFLLK